MKTFELLFNNNDDGLNLKGSVSFEDESFLENYDHVFVSSQIIRISGLAEWRHVPSNIVHVNKTFLKSFNMTEASKKFSKIGINYIGIDARSEVLIGFATRSGKSAQENVKKLLTKFFEAIGARAIKIEVDVEVEDEEVYE
jgi:hypothetical protein